MKKEIDSGKNQTELNQTKPSYEEIVYTPDEQRFRDMLINLAMIARQRRDTAHDEFDGMTYVEWWDKNNKIRNGYIQPKENPSDINATTGTAREKTNTMLAALLNLNLSPNIECYDKNDLPNEELGKVMEDMERKSREIEVPDYDFKMVKIYDEFLTQGTVHTAERFIEYKIPKITTGKLDMTNLQKLKLESGISKAYKLCDTELLVGLNVYPGNVREPSVEKQPFYFVRRLRSMSEAKALYGDWERWNNVPTLKRDFFAVANDYRPYNNWTLVGFRENYIEDLDFYDKWNNQWMKLLNGTMMFPVKQEGNQYITLPLSSLLGTCEYPIVKGDNESMPNFYYSRSVPSKARVEQELLDEFVKAAVKKTRQSYKPPMANNTGQELSSDIFDEATIWDDVDAAKLTQIIETPGVTSSEYQMLQFTKGMIDEKSVSSIVEGQEPSGDRTTATQIIEQRKAAMQKLGLTIQGITNFEKRRCLLRIWNILTHWTLPTKLSNGLSDAVNQYKTITATTYTKKGQGKRIIKMTQNLPEQGQLDAESKILADTGSKNIMTYINPDELRKTIEWTWEIIITPVPKQDSALKIVQFTDFLKNALSLSQVFGVKIKGEEALNRYAILNQEDPSKIFDFTPQQPPAMPPLGQPPVMQPMGLPIGMPRNSNLQQIKQKQPAQPSVNTLVKG
jgi:hypothetical protein